MGHALPAVRPPVAQGGGVLTSIMAAALAALYCWTPSSYDGQPKSPACALTYEQCQRLVYDHGGQCRSQ